MDQFVVIGELVKAIGLKGEVKLYPLLNYYEPLLESGFLVWEDGRQVDIVRHRQAGSCEAVLLKGVHERNGAEAMVGRRLGFQRDSYTDPLFPKPDGGLPFRFLGREVVTVEGKKVGVVDEVRFVGSNYLLVIPDGSRNILIPAVAPILQSDAGIEGNLVIDPPKGLLDVHRD